MLCTLGCMKLWNHWFVHFSRKAVAYLTHLRQDDPCVIYMKGVLSGKYQNTVFPGMIAAFVTLEDKKERGVGKQNFQYAPGFKEFMLILHSHGLHMYEFVAKHIPIMEDRSIQYMVNPTFANLTNMCQRKCNELHIPCFPVVICPWTFDLVHDHLAKLLYTGPVGLLCNDTKLSPAL